MAAANVTISGVLYDMLNKTQQRVTLIGAASLTGLGVGGGPIVPPDTTPPPDSGPPVVMPPIYLPPGIWPNPPEGQAPLPEHPIVIPPPDGSPPDTPAFTVHVLWSEETGWVILLQPNFPHATPSKKR